MLVPGVKRCKVIVYKVISLLVQVRNFVVDDLEVAALAQVEQLSGLPTRDCDNGGSGCCLIQNRVAQALPRPILIQ